MGTPSNHYCKYVMYFLQARSKRSKNSLLENIKIMTAESNQAESLKVIALNIVGR